eukprot:SAG31_NODE_39394_length_288_cov_1.153439_1_plen_33_part_01
MSQEFRYMHWYMMLFLKNDSWLVTAVGGMTTVS